MFPRFKTKALRNRFNEIDLLLYKEANNHAPHGYLCVSNKRLGLDRAVIAFAYPGVGEAPPLTAKGLCDIWSAAESQGYVIHHLESYGANVGGAVASLEHTEMGLTLSTDPVKKMMQGSGTSSISPSLTHNLTNRPRPALEPADWSGSAALFRGRASPIFNVTKEDVASFIERHPVSQFAKDVSALGGVADATLVEIKTLSSFHEMLPPEAMQAEMKNLSTGELVK